MHSGIPPPGFATAHAYIHIFMNIYAYDKIAIIIRITIPTNSKITKTKLK